MDELTLKSLQSQQEAEESTSHVNDSLQLWLHGILLYVLQDLTPERNVQQKERIKGEFQQVLAEESYPFEVIGEIKTDLKST